MRWVFGLLATLMLAAASYGQTYRLSWSSTFDNRQSAQAFPQRIVGSSDGGAYCLYDADSGNGTQFTYGDYVVAKLDSSGNTQWETHLGVGATPAISGRNSNITMSGKLTQVAEGVSGVFIGGTVDRLYASGDQVLLEKLDFAGQRKALVFTGSSVQFECMALDKQDNVYVFSNDTQSFGVTITKYDSNLNVVWTLPLLNNKISIVQGALTIDPSGNVVFSGAEESVAATNNIFTPIVIKLTPTGNIFWTFAPTPTDNFRRNILKMCSDGSMYLLSEDNDFNSTLSTVRKLNAAGTVVWSAPCGTHPNIGVDGSNNLYLEDTNVVTKYSSQGAKIWTKSLGIFQLLDADPSGNFLGLFQSGGTTQLQQYNSSGQIVWAIASPFQPFQGYESNFDISHSAIFYTRMFSSETSVEAAKVSSAGGVAFDRTNLATDRAQVLFDSGYTDTTGTTTIAGGDTLFDGWFLSINSSGAVTSKRWHSTDPFGQSSFPILRMPDGGFVALPVDINAAQANELDRYDASGNLLWSSPGLHYGATVDSAGNIYTSGVTSVNGVNTRAIFKLDPNGNQLWKYVTTNTDLMAVDPSGNLVTKGNEYSKWSPTGTLLWHVPPPTFSGGVLDRLYAHDEFDFDAQGNIYETFNAYTSGSTQGWLYKFSPSGQLIWQLTLATGLYSPVFSTILDGQGNLYSVGETRINGSNMMAVFCVDPSTGNIKWVRTPLYGDASCGKFVALDSNKNVVIGGWQHNGSYDYLVVRMTAAGVITGHGSYDSSYLLHESPDGMGLDSSNNVYIFGKAIGSSGTYDYNVAKFLPPLPDDADLTQFATTPMVAGGTYPITISAVNRGINTWTAGTGYKLDCLEPSTWGVTSVALGASDSIGSDQAKTFTANVVAPTTPGTYALQWQMERSGTKFGRTSQVINVVVLTQTNFASFVGQSVPNPMVCGQSYPVSLQYQNFGSNTWTPGSGYKLISVNPLGNMVWGVNRIPMTTSSVPGGATATFAGTVIAPSTPGTYNFQWRPIQDTTGLPFGPNSTNFPVTVTQGTDAARYLSQNVPTSVSSGKDFYAQFTMLNVGTSTWSTSGGYSILLVNSANGQPSNTWNRNTGYFAVGTIPPGAQATFAVLCTAPITPGTYSMLAMCDKLGSTFGDVTPLTSITVVPAADSAKYINENVPASMVPGATFNGTFTMQNVVTNTWDSSYSLVPLANNFGVTSISSTTVSPNANGTFSASFTAPSTPGNYNFQWRMSHNGSLFGQATPLIVMSVGPDAGIYVSRQCPLSIGAGTDFYIQNTMQNTGSTTWLSTASYSMMTVNPNNNLTWAKNRAYMPANSSIAPGSQGAFTALVTAPSTPGTYTMQWQLDKAGTPFGEKTPLVSINVVQSADDAAFESTKDPMPTSVPHGQGFIVTIYMLNKGTAAWTPPAYELVPIGTSNWGVSGIAPNTNALDSQFQATFTAPITPGTYTFQMRMWHSGVKFGDPTPLWTITVT